MFTGLIEATGRVVSLERAAGAARITVESSMAERLHLGDSIAVSGVCLTALAISATEFSADLAGETLARTTLGRLVPGATVNLELPTPAGSPLGGHVVQGHVDGTGVLVALKPLTAGAPTTDWRLYVQLPEGVMRYVVAQGSITIEGISLTVAAVRGHEIEIAIIPHTYVATNLRTLAPGDALNIETDVLARYAEKRGGEKPFELTEQFLIANGY